MRNYFQCLTGNGDIQANTFSLLTIRVDAGTAQIDELQEQVEPEQCPLSRCQGGDDPTRGLARPSPRIFREVIDPEAHPFSLFIQARNASCPIG